MCYYFLNKTPYELWKDRKPTIAYFHIFGYYCYILNNKDNLSKFDSKSDKAIFLGYKTTFKSYRVYNLRTRCTEESMHVVFDEFNDLIVESVNEDEDEHYHSSHQQTSDVSKQEDEDEPDSFSLSIPPSWKSVVDHPKELIIGHTAGKVRTRKSFLDKTSMAMISQREPKSINVAITDQSWIEAMTEELSQFQRNKVWNLVPEPQGKTIIETRWVFKNKLDENAR